MPSYYRTTASIAALIAINLAVRIFNLSLGDNLIMGNHLVDSVMVIGLISLLSDLKVIKTNHNYLRIGIIALIFGAVWEILSFSALFFGSTSSFILSEWIRIAPVMIFAIGIPVLYIADKVSRERLIFGMNSIGRNGIIFNMVFCGAYTLFAMFVLTKYGLLSV